MIPEEITVTIIGTDVAYDDEYVRRYWLPKIGPTSWALLATLYRYDRGGDTAHHVQLLAQAVGASQETVRRAFLRLRQFRLIDSDPTGACWYLAPQVRHLTEREVRRLPYWLQHREVVA